MAELQDFLTPAGFSSFAFHPPCPVECEAYSSGVSGKQKKELTLCALRASAVNL